MVKRATSRPDQRNGRSTRRDNRSGTARDTVKTRRSGLGPRGLGLLGKMFGSSGERPAPVPHHEATSIAIASGKGGTGKSFLATNLAVTLHQRLHRVTLADCDFGLACSHLLLGVTPKRTMQHLLSGEALLPEVRLKTPSGPTLIPGGSGIMQMAQLTDRQLLVLGRALADIACSEDVLLLDVGAGIAPQSVLTLLCADHVVMVTQPEIAALTDAYAVIKCCAQLRPEIHVSVVVNRVMVKGQGEATFEKLAKVAKRHTGVELEYLGEVGEDPSVTQRRLDQQPIVITDPEGATAESLRGIVDRLALAAAPLGRRQVDEENSLSARFRQHRLFLG